MFKKLVRLPPDAFLSRFVPYSGAIPDDAWFIGMFETIPQGGLEADIQDQMRNVVNSGSLIPKHMVFISTPHLADTKDSTKQKMDAALYPKAHAPPVHRSKNARANWGRVELSFEFKHEASQDPVDDTSNTADEDGYYPLGSDARAEVLGQIMSYAQLVFDHQPRTHHFTVVVMGDHARIFRWDRAGVVFTEKFNYKEHPHILGKFLYCFSRLDDTARGHDPTAVRVAPQSDHYKLMRKRATTPRVDEDGHEIDEIARKLFEKSLEDTSQRWKVAVHTADGPREYLMGMPNFATNTLAGKSTRGYVAIDLEDPDGPFVYLKDCWRVNHLRIQQEGSILAELNAGGVAHIPTLVCHGDVPEQVTGSQAVWKELHPGREAECPMKVHVHYRMVVKEVAEPLSSFENGRELVLILIYCLLAHEAAFALGYVHGDISPGNILIHTTIDDGEEVRKGLLADWELCKRLQDYSEGRRQPDRTGTWQFMSVCTQDDATNQVNIPDELESFFHVLLYEACRFIDNTCDMMTEFMFRYFEDSCCVGSTFYGGGFKRSTMTQGEIRSPIGEPFYFIQSRRKKSLPQRTGLRSEASPSLATISEADGTSDAADGSGQLLPSEQPTVEAPLKLHPIQSILELLLTLFHSHYFSLYEPPKYVVDSFVVAAAGSATSGKSHKKDPDAELRARFGNTRSKTWMEQAKAAPDTAEIAKHKSRAERLKTHQEFTRILWNAFRNAATWPEKDKLAERDDKNCKKNSNRLTEEDLTKDPRPSKKSALSKSSNA